MEAQVLQPTSGIRAFRHDLGRRFVQFYALDDGDEIVLFDTALPDMVMSWLDDGAIKKTSRAIISHADADHLGDTANLCRRFPDLRVACHQADREWVENHDLLTRARYDSARPDYGIGYPPETLTVLRQACGDDFTVHETLVDGQILTIGGRDWEVHHVAGHSPGHIALWHSDEGILLLADAVLGYGPPSYDGSASMPPTHQFIEDYLMTIDKLRTLPVQLALPAHWGFMDGDSFRNFLDESQACVEHDLALIHRACQQKAQTPSALLTQLNASPHATWHNDEAIHYFYALSGYLDYLIGRGELRQESDGYVAN